MTRPVSFDRLARPYRWLEYATFGSALMRCRRAALPHARRASRALVLGEGDGRFTAELLAAVPQISIVSVDQSAAMLSEARSRARGAAARVSFHQADALSFTAMLDPEAQFDFVATHFFLDCLRTDDVAALAGLLRPRLEPGALWAISEFAAPNRSARAVVALLYFAFHILTGLAVRRLPQYEAALARAGFFCLERTTALGGLLVHSLWQASPTACRGKVSAGKATGADAPASQQA